MQNKSAQAHVCMRRSGAEWWGGGGGCNQRHLMLQLVCLRFPPSSFVFLLFVFLSDLTWINCGPARFTPGCNCGENKERLKCERADSTLECWIARRCGSTAFAGAVFTRARHGGEPPVPASDRMCWLGSGLWTPGGPFPFLAFTCGNSIISTLSLNYSMPFPQQPASCFWGGGGMCYMRGACSVRHACWENAWPKGGVSNNWQPCL